MIPCKLSTDWSFSKKSSHVFLTWSYPKTTHVDQSLTGFGILMHVSIYAYICCTNAFSFAKLTTCRTLLVFSGVFTFLVDAYPLYAASSLAANSFARSSFGGKLPVQYTVLSSFHNPQYHILMSTQRPFRYLACRCITNWEISGPPVC